MLDPLSFSLYLSSPTLAPDSNQYPLPTTIYPQEQLPDDEEDVDDDADDEEREAEANFDEAEDVEGDEDDENAEEDGAGAGVEQLDEEVHPPGGADNDTVGATAGAEAAAAKAQGGAVEKGGADLQVDSADPVGSSAVGGDRTEGGSGGDDDTEVTRRRRKRRRRDEAERDDVDDGALDGDEGYSEDDEDVGVYDDILGQGDEDGEGDTSAEAQEEDDDEEQVHVGGKRKRVSEPQKRKDSIRGYYNTRHTYCGVTSYIMLELLRGTSGSHIQLDNIWQAVLGVTDQYQRQRIPEYRYNEMCDDLKMRLSDHLALSEAGAQYLIAREGEGDLQVQGSKVGHIKETPEFRFFMYRHWSLYDSMSYSPYVAAKLGAWQQQGSERLKELLAKLGMPLQQCKQSYNFMDPKLREHFRKKIQDVDRQQFKLDDPEVMYTSFCRFNSYKNPVVAFDVVLASQAILEACASHGTEEASSGSSASSSSGSSASNSSSSRTSRHQAFSEAYDCLGTKSDVLLKKGVESAISIQKVKKYQHFLPISSSY